MDHVRIVGGVLEFGFLTFEHTRWMPALQRPYIKDALLTLHGRTASLGGIPTGCDDVHIYLDNRDVTSLVTEQLKKQLDGPRTDEFRRQYRLALEEWIALETALGNRYPANDLVAETAKAKALAAIVPLSATLTKLGDPAAGWSGLLHIFNFLYSHIPLDPVSIAEIALRWNAVHSNDPIEAAKISHFTVSSGPWRRVAPDVVPVGRGAVALQMEFSYHDPLEDRVAELERRFNEFEQAVLGELEAITDALGADGAIQKFLASVQANATTIKRQLATVEQAQSSHRKQLDGLDTSTDELRRAVEKIK